MRVAVLFSGGKDSVYATGWAFEQEMQPVLVSVQPEEYSMMFHHPNAKWTRLQAEAMELEQVTLEAKENELDVLKVALSKMEIKGIVTGAIASEYQKQRIDKIGYELNVPTYSPLWHKDEVLYAEITQFFDTHITAVSAEGLGEDLLGTKYSELGKHKNIHPLLEGGEGETFVADAPFFKKKIQINKWKKDWDGVRGVAHIEEAELVEKSKKI